MSTLKTKPCIYCGTIFNKGYNEGKTRWNKRQYCSHKCSYSDQKNRPNKGWIKVGESLLDKINHREDCKCKKCCPPIGEKSPTWKGGKKEKSCLICKNNFLVGLWEKNRKTCSRICSNELRSSLCLKNKGNFKRKISLKKGLNQKQLLRHLRNLAEMRHWRRLVIKRDSHCINCGSLEDLHTDHIKPLVQWYKDYKWKCLQDVINTTDLWKISTGRVLCKDCHRNTKTWGRKT